MSDKIWKCPSCTREHPDWTVSCFKCRFDRRYGHINENGKILDPDYEHRTGYCGGPNKCYLCRGR